MTTDKTFKIPFSLANPWKFPLYGLPLRCSVPLPEGAVQDPAGELVLIDDRDGTDCAAQWRVLSTWNDGSARFALMDFAEAEMPPRTTRTYSLVERREAPDTCERTTITVSDDPDSLTVDTGRLAWTFNRQRFSFGESIRFDGRDWIAGRASDLCITDEQDRTFRASQGDCRLTLEENGPYRVIVRAEGVHGCGDERFMNYTVRFHFTAGGAQVLMLRYHMSTMPDPDAALRARLQRVPINEALTPNDIARNALYLCCEDSAGVTGTSLVVDNGYITTAEWDCAQV